MKSKIGVALLIGLLALWVPSAQSRPVSDTNNPHNLSNRVAYSGTMASDGTQYGAKEICIFCHTPHSASAGGPLWNRADPVGPFPLYNSGTLQIKGIAAAKYNTTDYPNGASKLCLSCHDGVTGIGTLLDRTLTMNHTTMEDVPIAVGYNAVIDLSQTHPVSFVYTSEVVAGINAPLPGTKAGYTLPTLTNTALLDSQSRVQCTTCHDPHDDRSEVLYNSAGIPPFWRYVSATEDPYTAVCNACHPGSEVTLPGNNHTLP